MKKCMFLVIAMLVLISLAFAQKAKYYSFGYGSNFTKDQVLAAAEGKDNLVRFPDLWKVELVKVFSRQNQALKGFLGEPKIAEIPAILAKCHVKLIPKGTVLQTSSISATGNIRRFSRHAHENEYGLYYEDVLNGKKISILIMSLFCMNPIYDALIGDPSPDPVPVRLDDFFVASVGQSSDNDGDGITDTENSIDDQLEPVSDVFVSKASNTSSMYKTYRPSSSKSSFKKNWPYYVGSAVLVGAAAYMIASSQSRNQPPQNRPVGPTGPVGDIGNGDTGNPNGDPGNGNPNPNPNDPTGPTGPVGDDGHGGRPSGYTPPHVFVIGFSTSFSF